MAIAEDVEYDLGIICTHPLAQAGELKPVDIAYKDGTVFATIDRFGKLCAPNGDEMAPNRLDQYHLGQIYNALGGLRTGLKLGLS